MIVHEPTGATCFEDDEQTAMDQAFALIVDIAQDNPIFDIRMAFARLVDEWDRCLSLIREPPEEETDE